MPPKIKEKFNITNNRMPNKLLHCYTRLYNSRAEHNKDNDIPEIPDNIMPNTIFYIKDWDLYVPNTKIYRDGLNAEFDFKIEKGNQVAVKKATIRNLTEDTNKIIVSLVAPELEPQNKNVVESFINVYKTPNNIPEVIEIEPEKIKEVKKYGKPKDKETRDKEGEKKLLDYKKMVNDLDSDMKLLISDIDGYDEKLSRKDLTQFEYDLFEDLRDKAIDSLKILEREYASKKKNIPENKLADFKKTQAKEINNVIYEWTNEANTLPVLFGQTKKYQPMIKHIEGLIKKKVRLIPGYLFWSDEGSDLVNKLFEYYNDETNDVGKTMKIIDDGIRDIVKYLDGGELLTSSDDYYEPYYKGLNMKNTKVLYPLVQSLKQKK